MTGAANIANNKTSRDDKFLNLNMLASPKDVGGGSDLP
jgi:hypothetical protein